MKHFHSSFSVLIALALATGVVTVSLERQQDSPAEGTGISDGAAELVTGPSGVTCTGSATGGSSNRKYKYRVYPGAGNSISWIEIGVHDDDISNFTNFILPTGWAALIDEFDPTPHHTFVTQHGVKTPFFGNCPHVLYCFATDGQFAKTTPFNIGFNHPGEPHDATWQLSDASIADWSKKLGTGRGPVHSPGIYIDDPWLQAGETDDGAGCCADHGE